MITTERTRVAAVILGVVAMVGQGWAEERHPPVIATMERAAAMVKFQYRITVHAPDVKAKDKDLRKGISAHVWLPPAVKTIRGLFLAAGEIIQSEAVRKVCLDQAIGIVDFGGWLRRFHFWSEGDRDPEELLRMTNIIAERTGHSELRRAPWITFGHSTSGIFCRNVAYWKPERVAGVIHYKSGNFHQKDQLPPSGSLAGVPMLVINGQYESCGPDGIEQLEEKDSRLDRRYGRETQWIYARSDIQKFRDRDPNHLMSLVLDLGGDHYFGSPELWAQAALFLRKTAQRRIPAELAPGDEPVRCLEVKVESGWLSDADLKEPKHKPAPWAEYTGDKSKAFWHYDRETAEAAVRHHQNLNNPQCLQNPEWTWLDEGDGWTFRAKSGWLDTLPDAYCGPLAGMKVGHSEQQFEFRGGPPDSILQLGPDMFRLLRPVAVAIAAVHPGDAKYRATNRWTVLKPPEVKGEKQVIEFAPIAGIKADSPGIELKATASSGLPVYFEVDYGPVVIEGGKLVVRDLPSNPQYPIECQVTAWQIGRRVGKPVEPALPVSRTFSVVAP
jgi:hypothetical protein